jgi:hypothetical protein
MNLLPPSLLRSHLTYGNILRIVEVYHSKLCLQRRTATLSIDDEEMMTEDEMPVAAQRTPPPATSRQGGSAPESGRSEEYVREVHNASML